MESFASLAHGISWSTVEINFICPHILACLFSIYNHIIFKYQYMLTYKLSL